MADDTRQPPLTRADLTVDPTAKSFAGTQWQDGNKPSTYKPPENANLMAGGTEHTAGGKVPEVTLANAFPKLNEFKDLPKKPCVRDAFMTGIASGFAFGGVRAIFGATVWSSCTWAVLSFCGSAPAMHIYCQYRRQAEKEGMMRAVEILNKKDVEKKAREARKEKVREERRLLKDKETDERLEALKARTDAGGGGRPWWKVW